MTKNHKKLHLNSFIHLLHSRFNEVILLVELFLLLIPLMVVSFLPLYTLGRVFKKKKSVIFAGLEHVIDKTVNRGRYFLDQGFDVFYYSFELTGKKSEKLGQEKVVVAKTILSFDIIQYIFLIITKRPVYLELYFEKSGINQIFYSLFAKSYNTFVISILRGELYDLANQKQLRTFLRSISWKISDFIFYRETYMPDYFNKVGINKKKTFFDPNSVVVENEVEFTRNSKTVLFLNGIKKWRNIELFINAIPLVLKEIPDAQFLIVGCRNQTEFDYVQYLVIKIGITNNIQIKDWTTNPKPYYEQASVFVLPADLIYCNFSLLEIMERGVPAIVSDVKDADKIIKHGVNGYTVKKEISDLAHYIIKLLINEDLRLNMGMEARQTIIKGFNDNKRMLPIFDLLKRKYKNAFPYSNNDGKKQ